MPRVSVIIPSHNCATYLEDAIESVLKQSYSDFELLVIDDSSTDDTEATVKKYLSDRRVKYIKNPNKKGPSFTRNRGIDVSEGELIAFLDADDLFEKDKLLKQLKLFDSCNSCSISYTNEIYFREGKPKDKTPSCRKHLNGDIFYYLKRSNFIHISAVMIKSNIIKNNKFNESEEVIGHEDWELCLRLAYKGFRFMYAKDVLSRIRIRPDSLTTTKKMDISRKNVGQMARAYWKEFKKSMNLFTIKGQCALLRYISLKTKAFLTGFPYRKCFNRPVPHELL